MSKLGFTLIEMMAVLLLLSLLAGAAVVGFAAPLRAARARQAVEQVGASDASARQAARRSGRDVELIIDLSEQQLIRRESREDTRGTLRTSLPAGFRIDQIRTGERVVSAGTISIRCSPQGLSRTYALRLVGPEFDQWLLVAGLSGQMKALNDESLVASIFAELSRRDAH